MASCMVVSDATVVGIGPWPPALKQLARRNVAAAGKRVYELLQPGGRVIAGVTFRDESELLAQATDDLVTVRSGGSVSGSTTRSLV